jgi:hypothetical protein
MAHLAKRNLPVNLSKGNACSTTLCKTNILYRETPVRATGGVFFVSGVDFVLGGGFHGVSPCPSSLDLIFI